MEAIKQIGGDKLMIIQPKIHGVFCLNAHPTGCRLNVERQAEYAVSAAKKIRFVNALVIGASTGYGLASRIALGLGCGIPTIGAFLEREPQENRTASAGWYNTAAFSDLASERGMYARSVNGDAFSEETKRKVAELIRADFGKLDLLVYSLAAPKRITKDGKVYSSVIKPIGKSFAEKTVDLKTETLKNIEIAPATQEEIFATVKVMGGEDWREWIDFLSSENLLSDKFATVAYSYIGPELTYPVYRDGTIGEAKKHLERTADEMRKSGTDARIAINKAVVTQAGAAIPVVPLYMSVLMRVMKEKGVHEKCIEQICRLFFEKWDSSDENGILRLDDFELSSDVQKKVSAVFGKLNDGNLCELADIAGYKTEFSNAFGFGFPEIDYNKDVDHLVGFEL